MEDMTMKVYSLDSSASAVVLFDYGVAQESQFERHTRIKILKKEGLGQADISLPLFGKVSVSNLKAVTYNLAGNKIIESKLSKEGTFKERLPKTLICSPLHFLTFERKHNRVFLHHSGIYIFPQLEISTIHTNAT